MNATATLSQEHQLILKYVELMQRTVEFNLHNPDSALLFVQANSFISFIHDFADRFHHAKEEEILFRYLAEPGVLAHCNPIPQMLWEHQQARGFVQSMEHALHSKNLAELGMSINHYAQLLKEHIYKEDNILYPMAERGLTEAQKASLLEEYATTDQRLDSTAIWQHYETLWVELQQTLNHTLESIT